MDPNGNGNDTKPWVEQIKPEFRDHEAIKSISDVNHLVETHIATMGEITKLKGDVASSIKIPGESASKEEISAYRKAIGVPDKAEDYDIPVPKGSGDKIAQWARGVFHAAGLPAPQAKQIAEAWNSFLSSEAEARKTERETALKTGIENLKKDWGDKFEGNVAIVKKLETRLLEKNKGMAEWITSHNYESDPTLLNFLLQVAPAFLDDSSLNSDPKPGDGEFKDGQFHYPDMGAAG